MSSPKVMEYPITMDKVRHIRVDMNAMIKFQELTGVNILQSFNADSLQDPTILRALVYACLLHEDENVTLELVGSHLGFVSIKDITIILIKAVNNAYPDAEELEDIASSGDGPLAEILQKK